MMIFGSEPEVFRDQPRRATRAELGLCKG